jgi:hypothetical protein
MVGQPALSREKGSALYKVAWGTMTFFATMTGCAEDHTVITFDHCAHIRL